MKLADVKHEGELSGGYIILEGQAKKLCAPAQLPKIGYQRTGINFEDDLCKMIYKHSWVLQRTITQRLPEVKEVWWLWRTTCHCEWPQVLALKGRYQ